MNDYGNIEDRRQALVRIVAALVAMAGLSLAVPAAGAPRPTLTRRLRNAVLRLLRPAESATRRLVVALAQGLVVVLPQPRGPRPKPLHTGRPYQPQMPVPPTSSKTPLRATLPLLDPVRRMARDRAPSRCGVPIISFGGQRHKKIPPRPSPSDRLDATRLGLRLDALQRALADLPAQARRLARWRARQERLRGAGVRAFRDALRPGRPPGTVRRAKHAVDDILAFCHSLALEARRDTS